MASLLNLAANHHTRIYSFLPLSVFMALIMILCGSQDETKERIMKAFGLDSCSSEDTELIKKFQKLTSKYPAVELSTICFLRAIM